MARDDVLITSGGPETAPAAEARHRILVVAPMKSASTYTSNLLRQYFQMFEMPNLSGVDFSAPHNLTPALLELLAGHDFCFNFHMLPHPSNLAAAAHGGITLVHLWRNIADMLVSMDDHSCTVDENGPVLFMLDHERYRSLPPEERFAFLIDTVTPWYIAFYLLWRQRGVVMHPYEWMLDDRHAYFTTILEQITGAPPDEALLDVALAVAMQAILTRAPGTEYRFNVGRAGRSATKFDEPTKRRLEDRLIRHPDREQLEILLWELPWEVPVLEPRAPLDGKLVAGQGDRAPFFVSRGIAHPIANPSWMHSRVPGRREPELVEQTELDAYPVGTPLL